MRVAVCQLDSRAGHRSAALEALTEHVARTGADLVVLPELPFSAWLAAEPVPDLDAWAAGVVEHEAAIALSRRAPPIAADRHPWPTVCVRRVPGCPH